MTASIADLWRRLEAYAQKQGASLDLAPPADAAAIAAAEAAMGVSFPADFRASLALHDGQTCFTSGDPRDLPWLAGCPPLAPLAKIVEQWKELQGLAADMPGGDQLELGDRLKNGVYRTGRIPIAGTPWWDGDVVYLDLDPGPAGVSGQVAATVSECDFVIVDDSFSAALERWVTALETGSWKTPDGHGAYALAKYR